MRRKVITISLMILIYQFLIFACLSDHHQYSVQAFLNVSPKYGICFMNSRINGNLQQSLMNRPNVLQKKTSTSTPSVYHRNVLKKNFIMLKVSSGFSFDDGYQILISAKKPLGMVLEEREVKDDEIHENGKGNGCIVVEIDENGSAYKGGVRVGDWLVAVQNADVSTFSIEEILNRIGKSPPVVNLRFQRAENLDDI